MLENRLVDLTRFADIQAIQNKEINWWELIHCVVINCNYNRVEIDGETGEFITFVGLQNLVGEVKHCVINVKQDAVQLSQSIATLNEWLNKTFPLLDNDAD